MLLVLAGSACSKDARSPAATQSPVPSAAQAQTVLPVAFGTADVRAGERVLHFEVASDSSQSERGLGYRDFLAADSGMLFDLHRTLVPQFWMKGMRFVLDFVWIDDTKHVASVTKGVPPEPGVADAALRRYSPSDPVRWVIEVNAGAADRLGLTPGTQLAFDLAADAPH